MATKQPQLTGDELRANALRCGVCGKFHPLMTICPYIKSQRVETLRDVKNPSLRGRITLTEYFPRPELMLSAIDSLEEAESALNE